MRLAHNTAAPTKGEQSRDIILAAAGRLIAERGFNAITLQEILEAAQVKKGRFFHYFSSKEDLFRELLRAALTSRSVLHFEELLADCPSREPFPQLLFLLDRYIKWHEKGLPDAMRLCLFATFFFPESSPEMQSIHERLSRNAAVLEQLLRSCRKQNLLPRELDCGVLALLFPSCTVGGNIIGHLSKKPELTVKNLLAMKTMLILIHERCRNGKENAGRNQ